MKYITLYLPDASNELPSVKEVIIGGQNSIPLPRDGMLGKVFSISLPDAQIHPDPITAQVRYTNHHNDTGDSNDKDRVEEQTHVVPLQLHPFPLGTLPCEVATAVVRLPKSLPTKEGEEEKENEKEESIQEGLAVEALCRLFDWGSTHVSPGLLYDPELKKLNTVALDQIQTVLEAALLQLCPSPPHHRPHPLSGSMESELATHLSRILSDSVDQFMFHLLYMNALYQRTDRGEGRKELLERWCLLGGRLRNRIPFTKGLVVLQRHPEAPLSAELLQLYKVLLSVTPELPAEKKDSEELLVALLTVLHCKEIKDDDENDGGVVLETSLQRFKAVVEEQNRSGTLNARLARDTLMHALALLPPPNWKDHLYGSLLHLLMKYDFSQNSEDADQLFALYRLCSVDPQELFQTYMNGLSYSDTVSTRHRHRHRAYRLTFAVTHFIQKVEPIHFSEWVTPWYDCVKTNRKDPLRASHTMYLMAAISKVCGKRPKQPSTGEVALLSTLFEETKEDVKRYSDFFRSLAAEISVEHSENRSAALKVLHSWREDLQLLFNEQTLKRGPLSQESVQALWTLYSAMLPMDSEGVQQRLQDLFSLDYPSKVSSLLEASEADHLSRWCLPTGKEEEEPTPKAVWNSCMDHFSQWVSQKGTVKLEACASHLTLFQHCVGLGWEVRQEELTLVQTEYNRQKQRHFSVDERKQLNLLERGALAEKTLHYWVHKCLPERREESGLVFFLLSPDGLQLYREIKLLCTAEFWKEKRERMGEFMNGQKFTEELHTIERVLANIITAVEHGSLTLNELCILSDLFQQEGKYNLLDRFFPIETPTTKGRRRELVSTTQQSRTKTEALLEQQLEKELYNVLTSTAALNIIPPIIQHYFQKLFDDYFLPFKKSSRDEFLVKEMGKHLQSFQKTIGASALLDWCHRIQQYSESLFVTVILQKEQKELETVLSKVEKVSVPKALACLLGEFCAFVVEASQKVYTALRSPKQCSMQTLQLYLAKLVPQPLRPEEVQELTWEEILHKDEAATSAQRGRLYSELDRLERVVDAATSPSSSSSPPTGVPREFSILFQALMAVSFQEDADHMVSLLSEGSDFTLSTEVRNALELLARADLKLTVSEYAAPFDTLMHATPHRAENSFPFHLPLGFPRSVQLDFLFHNVFTDSTASTLALLQGELALTKKEVQCIQHVTTVLDHREVFSIPMQHTALDEYMKRCGEACAPSLLFLFFHHSEVRLLLQDDRRLSKATGLARKFNSERWVFTLCRRDSLPREFSGTIQFTSDKKVDDVMSREEMKQVESELVSYGHSRTDDSDEARLIALCGDLDELCRITQELYWCAESTAEELESTGHQVLTGRQSIQKEIDIRKERLTSWRRTVEATLHLYPQLTLLTPSQLSTWRTNLGEGEGKQKVREEILSSMLPYTPSAQNISLCLSSDGNWLTELGKALQRVTRLYYAAQTISAEFYPELETFPSLVQLCKDIQKDYLLVTTFTESGKTGAAGYDSGILLWVLTVYWRNMGRFPYHYEILQCTPTTTREELEGFLRRWDLFSHRDTPSEGPHLFTLINPEILSSSLPESLRMGIYRDKDELHWKADPTLLLCGSVSVEQAERFGLGKWEPLSQYKQWEWTPHSSLMKVVKGALVREYSDGVYIRSAKMEIRYIDQDYLPHVMEPMLIGLEGVEQVSYAVVRVADENDLIQQLSSIERQRSPETNNLLVRLSVDPFTNPYTLNKLLFSFFVLGRVTNDVGSALIGLRDQFLCTFFNPTDCKNDPSRSPSILQRLYSPTPWFPSRSLLSKRLLIQTLYTPPTATANLRSPSSIYKVSFEKDVKGFMAIQMVIWCINYCTGNISALPTYRELQQQAHGDEGMPRRVTRGTGLRPVLTPEELVSLLAYFVYRTPENVRGMSDALFSYAPPPESSWRELLHYYYFIREAVYAIIESGDYREKLVVERKTADSIRVGIMRVLCSGESGEKHGLVPRKELPHLLYPPSCVSPDGLKRFEAYFFNGPLQALTYPIGESNASDADPNVISHIGDLWKTLSLIAFNPTFPAALKAEVDLLQSTEKPLQHVFPHLTRLFCQVTGATSPSVKTADLRRSFDTFSAFIRGKQNALFSTPYCHVPATLECLCRIKAQLVSGVTVLLTGETATGKTALAYYFALSCGLPFLFLTCQPNRTERELIRIIFDFVEENSEEECLVVLDEVNQLPHVWGSREWLAERTLQGRRLPPSVHLIATRNPERDPKPYTNDLAVFRHVFPTALQVTMEAPQKLHLSVPTVKLLLRNYLSDPSLDPPLGEKEVEEVVEVWYNGIFSRSLSYNVFPLDGFILTRMVYDMLFASQPEVYYLHEKTVFDVLEVKKVADQRVFWTKLVLALIKVMGSSSVKGTLRTAQVWRRAFFFFLPSALKVQQEGKYTWMKTTNDVVMSACILSYSVTWGMQYDSNKRYEIMGRIREQFGLDSRLSSREMFRLISRSLAVFPKNVDGNDRMVEMFLAILFTNFGGEGNCLFLLGPPGAGKTLSIYIQQWATGTFRSSRSADTSSVLLHGDPYRPLRPLSVQCTPDTTPRIIQEMAERAADIDASGSTRAVLVLDEVSRMNGSEYHPLCELRTLLDKGVFVPSLGRYKKINIVCVSNGEIESTTMDRFLLVHTLAPTERDLASTAYTLNSTAWENKNPIPQRVWEAFFKLQFPWFKAVNATQGPKAPPLLTLRDDYGLIHTLSILLGHRWSKETAYHAVFASLVINLGIVGKNVQEWSDSFHQFASTILANHNPSAMSQVSATVRHKRTRKSYCGYCKTIQALLESDPANRDGKEEMWEEVEGEWCSTTSPNEAPFQTKGILPLLLKTKLPVNTAGKISCRFRHALVLGPVTTSLLLLDKLQYLKEPSRRCVILSRKNIYGTEELEEEMAKVKVCITRGYDLVIVQAFHIFHYINDVLNQHYNESDHKKQGQYEYYSVLNNKGATESVAVHPDFRVISLLTEEDYHRMEGPLRGRFVKLSLSVKDSLPTSLLDQLESFYSRFNIDYTEVCKELDTSPEAGVPNVGNLLYYLIPGFSKDLLYTQLTSNVAQTARVMEEGFESYMAGRLMHLISPRRLVNLTRWSVRHPSLNPTKEAKQLFFPDGLRLKDDLVTAFQGRGDSAVHALVFTSQRDDYSHSEGVTTLFLEAWSKACNTPHPRYARSTHLSSLGDELLGNSEECEAVQKREWGRAVAVLPGHTIVKRE